MADSSGNRLFYVIKFRNILVWVLLRRTYRTEDILTVYTQRKVTKLSPRKFLLVFLRIKRKVAYILLGGEGIKGTTGVGIASDAGHRIKIKTEEKAKVVAGVWGT